MFEHSVNQHAEKQFIRIAELAAFIAELPSFRILRFISATKIKEAWDLAGQRVRSRVSLLHCNELRTKA